VSRKRVFLDSGILVALLSRRDAHHAQARVLFDGGRPRWSTSVLVRSEAYSWFLHKHGEESARTLRLFLESLPELEVFPADEAHHIDVCRVLDRHRGVKLTYVDASSLALMGKHRIRVAWATDHHLSIDGALVVPRA